MPFINVLHPIPPVSTGGCGNLITPERIWVEDRPENRTAAEEYLLQYVAENARLRAALEWYAADDARLFEHGLVEHVTDRPATEALK